MAESEELKSPLMKVKEKRKKAGLKLNIQKIKIMASSFISSWQTDGETMKTVTDFYFLGLQNHCGDYSHEIKRCSLLGRKAIKNLEKKMYGMKKQRHYFADTGMYSQSYGFSISHVWI